ncbi:MAG: hypothetical protein AAB177_00405 [Nitrospirota bacterium]|jgi:hypothetical protein
MNDHNFHHREFPRKTAELWPQLLIGAIAIGMVSAWIPAQAGESQTLWECSNYTGNAHTRCLEGFAEAQRDQIAALQGKLQAQQETVKLLKDQLDRQASASAELQRQLARPPVMVPAAPSLYTSPSVGFGLYLGSPWIYGSPYYYSPFYYGPRYYGLGYWGHRW